MPPKKQKATTFSNEHKEALQRGFKEFNWDPYETDGRQIKRIIESCPELLVVLKPLFGTSDGGTKANNNSLYGHYKTQASEYILLCARKGIRRRGLQPKRSANDHSQSDSSSRETTGAYLENQTREGARKRGFTGGDDEEDDDEDMNRKPGASASKAKGKGQAKPGEATDEESPMDDLEFLMKRLEDMKLEGGESGFNFSCIFPHIWWTFTHNAQRYLKVDFLVWGNVERDIYPEITKDGRTLILHNRIVERFINMERVYKVYENNLGGDADSCEASMYQEGKKLCNLIHEHFDMKPIMPALCIDLPYEVLPQFTDGHLPNSKGYGLKGYPHEDNADRKIYIYHVNLREANRNREQVETEYEDVTF